MNNKKSLLLVCTLVAAQLPADQSPRRDQLTSGIDPAPRRRKGMASAGDDINYDSMGAPVFLHYIPPLATCYHCHRQPERDDWRRCLLHAEAIFRSPEFQSENLSIVLITLSTQLRSWRFSFFFGEPRTRQTCPVQRGLKGNN